MPDLSGHAPKVSVIIPSYNHAHYLPIALQSVLDQTYRDFEVIVIDDGSTDNTGEVMARFSSPQVVYHYQNNRGLAAARNAGIALARGKYISLLDADDSYTSQKLAVQVEWLETHDPCGMVIGGWNYMDETGHLIGGFQPEANPPELTMDNWLMNCFTNPTAVLFKKEWVDRVGGFDETLRQVEDWDLWLRFAYAGCKMGWVHAVVSNYRFSPGQMTRNAALQKKSTIQMMDKFFSQSSLTANLAQLKNEVYSRIYLMSAAREYGMGQLDEACESLSRACSFQPERLKTWSHEQINLFFSLWEDSPYFDGDYLGFRQRVFEHLPTSLNHLSQQKNWALEEAGLRTFYVAYQKRDWPTVRQAARSVILSKPTKLFDRGFLSILYQSFRARGALK